MQPQQIATKTEMKNDKSSIINIQSKKKRREKYFTIICYTFKFTFLCILLCVSPDPIENPRRNGNRLNISVWVKRNPILCILLLYWRCNFKNMQKKRRKNGVEWKIPGRMCKNGFLYVIISKSEKKEENDKEGKKKLKTSCFYSHQKRTMSA